MGNDANDSTNLASNKSLLSYMASVDDDADSATQDAKKLLSSAGMKGLPSSDLAEFRADIALVDKTGADVNSLWNSLIKKPGKVDPLWVAWANYATAIGALQESCAYWDAVADANLAACAGQVTLLLKAFVNVIGQQLPVVQSQIAGLQKATAKAKSEVTQAKVQQGLNVALSLFTMVAPEIKAVSACRLAVVAIIAHLEIDEMLGPTGPGALATGVTVMGDAEGVVGHVVKIEETLKSVGGKLLGVAGLLATAKLDEDEIDEAKHKLQELEDNLEGVLKRVTLFRTAIVALTPQIPALKRGLQGAIGALKAAKSKQASARENYKLLKSFVR